MSVILKLMMLMMFNYPQLMIDFCCHLYGNYRFSFPAIWFVIKSNLWRVGMGLAVSVYISKMDFIGESADFKHVVIMYNRKLLWSENSGYFARACLVFCG